MPQGSIGRGKGQDILCRSRKSWWWTLSFHRAIHKLNLEFIEGIDVFVGNSLMFMQAQLVWIELTMCCRDSGRKVRKWKCAGGPSSSFVQRDCRSRSIVSIGVTMLDWINFFHVAIFQDWVVHDSHERFASTWTTQKVLLSLCRNERTQHGRWKSADDDLARVVPTPKKSLGTPHFLCIYTQVIIPT